MAETRFVESADHTRIAFDVSGNGPALLLLHGGFIQNRRTWHEAGYLDRLSKEFTVIAIDLRGHGESDRPTTPERYAPDRFIEDIHVIAEACGFKRFYVWGYSLGGTVGLQIASRMEETIGAILVGVWFGKLFTPEMVAMAMSRYEAVEKARAEGLLGKMEMTAVEKNFFSKVDTSFLKTFALALAAYPPVEPAELLCPALMIAGTENQPAFSKLNEREGDIRNAGVQTLFLQGFDHERELSDIDSVLPQCISFFRSARFNPPLEPPRS
jgi:pimeloyl-ACP methyl ester carboxylesterase